ncbi:hypothetical protein LINPERHAP1_LOCUS17731 [Linum perenne]
MLFTYVVAGWEGTANDARILSETASNPNNQEIRRRGGPRGREELFNYRHSSLQNVIERKQTRIVMACCTIHNFIRLHATRDELFDQFQDSDAEDATVEALIARNISTIHLKSEKWLKDVIQSQTKYGIITNMLE